MSAGFGSNSNQPPQDMKWIDGYIHITIQIHLPAVNSSEAFSIGK